ncbi:Fis family transcriptional regulator [Mycolicibacterium sp.]|uniref:Fis family transcriptional regulator n=1 Tax=Mycolicibacterium sp. TaxID=2320850 RepID=UPI0037C7359F
MKGRTGSETWHEQLRRMQDEHAQKIRSAVRDEVGAFSEQMNRTSLQAAVDVWSRHVSPDEWSQADLVRLARDVGRGRAAETKDVQVIRCALLRAAGLDERPAAAAAVEAGATYVEIAAVLGMTQQGARARVRSYRADSAAEARESRS